MKRFLLALFLLPTLSHAQTLVAKASDGAKWLIYVETISVGDALQNRDRIVSALVEKRDEQRPVDESDSPIHDRLLHAWRRDYPVGRKRPCGGVDLGRPARSRHSCYPYVSVRLGSC